jgi:glutamyl-tRNA reductase
VALIGVTSTTRRCAETLRRARVPFVVVNRTVARAEALVAALGAGRAQPLEEFCRAPPPVEALLSATGAHGPVLERAVLERLALASASREPPLVVDLAVPPDVEPDAACAARLQRIGMDEVNAMAERRRESRKSEAAAARRVVDEALSRLQRRLAERELAPVLARIQRCYRRTALEGVDRLLADTRLACDSAGREALERWAESLGRRLAHLPTLGLRGLVAEYGPGAVDAFLAACGDARFVELEQESERVATQLRSLDPEARRWARVQSSPSLTPRRASVRFSRRWRLRPSRFWALSATSWSTWRSSWSPFQCLRA